MSMNYKMSIIFNMFLLGIIKKTRYESKELPLSQCSIILILFKGIFLLQKKANRFLAQANFLIPSVMETGLLNLYCISGITEYFPRSLKG